MSSRRSESSTPRACAVEAHELADKAAPVLPPIDVPVTVGPPCRDTARAPDPIRYPARRPHGSERGATVADDGPRASNPAGRASVDRRPPGLRPSGGAIREDASEDRELPLERPPPRGARGRGAARGGLHRRRLAPPPRRRLARGHV